jgi:hypothetical protein
MPNTDKNTPMPQCDKKAVSESLQPNSFALWAIRNGWNYNFCDNKWWQRQESQNYIKKTTEELAIIIKNESNVY